MTVTLAELKAFQRAGHFAKGSMGPKVDAAIRHIEAGGELLTAHVRDVMEHYGVFGSVFSAPATTVNRSLLRLTLNAGMSDTDVQRLVDTCRIAREDMRLGEWSASRRAARESLSSRVPEVA